MENDTNRQASVDSRRIALEREIAIRVPRFDTFVTEYSSNISTTGMFIVSENPQPPGTSFSFEFSVADDWKLIRGKAQVVWTRYRDEGPERPPGMGVRFLEVDAQSRRLVRWIVEKHIREGGKPFELDELRTVIDQALEEVLEDDDIMHPEPQAAPAAASGRRPKSRSRPSVRNAASARVTPRGERRVMPLLLTAAAVVLTVGLLFWLTEWLPDKKATEDSVATAGETSVEAPPPSGDPALAENVEPIPETGESTPPIEQAESQAATVAAELTPPTASEPPPVGSAYKSVLDSVTRWADAWSDQDVARYLSAYTTDFTPGGGVTRRQWEAQRQERLSAPDFINVAISGLEFERLSDDRVRVSFTQSYRSNTYSDTVRKLMELRWERGGWKIAGERSA